MRKGRDGEKKKQEKKWEKKRKKKKRRMKIVATTSMPAVERPNADRWNAARANFLHHTTIYIKYTNNRKQICWIEQSNQEMVQLDAKATVISFTQVIFIRRGIFIRVGWKIENVKNVLWT